MTIIMLSPAEIQDLLMKLPQGDRLAWKLFIDKFNPLIQGTIQKYVNEKDSQDATQQVYLALMEKDFRLIRKFENDSFPALLIYIQNISRNIGMRYRSKSSKYDQKNEYLENTHSELVDKRVDIEIHFIQKMDRETLEGYIHSLDKIYSEVLMLRLEGYKAVEISEVLGLPENTILTRMSRGRKILKKIMEVK